MKDSVFNDLIQLGINFGFAIFFFGFVYGVVICVIKCYKNDSNHHGTSDDLVTITIMERSGIKPSVLRSIPIVDFNSKDFKDNVECVVCLSDLVDGDKARVLPSCNHWFHADCINSWFRSNSTCPICRKRVIRSEQRGKRQEFEGDESLTQNNDQCSEPSRLPTDPPPSTNTTVVDDQGELNDVQQGLTAVVVDIPAKRSESLSAS